jgi:hypothetical protein
VKGRSVLLLLGGHALMPAAGRIHRGAAGARAGASSLAAGALSGATGH